MIQIKRAYEPHKRGDGYRVLVDRLWPRGMKKEDLEFDEWAKDIAPSPELRKMFGHKPENWKTFRAGYLREIRRHLKSGDAAGEKLDQLARRARRSKVTLLYAAHDPVYNHAQVLKSALEKET